MSLKSAIASSLTTFILVTASVVITLVVVGFAFGTLTYNSVPTVKQDGSFIIKENGGSYCLEGEVTSSGKVVVDSVAVDGKIENVSYTLQDGVSKLTLPLPSQFSPIPGDHYQVILGLSDGITLNANSYYP